MARATLRLDLRESGNGYTDSGRFATFVGQVKSCRPGVIGLGLLVTVSTGMTLKQWTEAGRPTELEVTL